MNKSEQNAKYYREHKAERNAYNAKYYLEHREERLERMARYHLENTGRRNRAGRARYHANKARYDKVTRAWRIANPEHYAFLHQRTKARSRGIEFLFTLEAWIEWWGDDMQFRGKAADQLCMGRYGDVGPYRVGNIYKASNSENSEGPRPLPVPEF